MFLLSKFYCVSVNTPLILCVRDLCDYGAFTWCRNNLKIECLTGKVTWSDCPIRSSQMGDDVSRSAADVWFRNTEEKNYFNGRNFKKDKDLCCEPHSCHSHPPPHSRFNNDHHSYRSNVGYRLSNMSLVCVTLNKWFHVRSVTCAVGLCFNDAHMCPYV